MRNSLQVADTLKKDSALSKNTLVGRLLQALGRSLEASGKPEWSEYGMTFTETVSDDGMNYNICIDYSEPDA